MNDDLQSDHRTGEDVSSCPCVFGGSVRTLFLFFSHIWNPVINNKDNCSYRDRCGCLLLLPSSLLLMRTCLRWCQRWLTLTTWLNGPRYVVCFSYWSGLSVVNMSHQEEVEPEGLLALIFLNYFFIYSINYIFIDICLSFIQDKSILVQPFEAFPIQGGKIWWLLPNCLFCHVLNEMKSLSKHHRQFCFSLVLQHRHTSIESGHQAVHWSN